MRSLEEVLAWLELNPDARSEGATYVVDLEGTLRLAPRRSEHVGCAKGADVLAAGEIRFAERGPAVEELSNQSTGYCPDVTCFDAVARALRTAGLGAPARFSTEIVFRRCVRCAQINLVKEGWFICVFCEADLPADWNVSEREVSEIQVGNEAGLRGRFT